MRSDDGTIAIEECTLPGTITVTPAALDLAQQFQAAIPSKWMVVFTWYVGRGSRPSNDAPWVDEGPGLDFGTYLHGDIPEEAIYSAGSFRYAVLVRQEIVDLHPQKTIDVDECGKIVLK